MEQKFLKPYQMLLKKSIVDLNSAKVIFISFEEGNIDLDLEVVMFHLQQSAEKIIKAILDYNHIKFPHTHDLKDLVDLLNDNDIVIAKVEKLISLSIYAVEGRYGMIHDDLNDVGKYMAILDEIIHFVSNIIKKETKS